jgi:hypothetical protein
MISELPVITLEAVLAQYLDSWDGTIEHAADFPLGGANLSAWVSMVVACRPYMVERLAYIMSEEAEQELYTLVMCSQTDDSVHQRRKSDIAHALLKVRVIWHVIQMTLDAATTVSSSAIVPSITDALKATMTRVPDGIPSLVAACLEPIFTMKHPAWWLPEYQWWRATRTVHRDDVIIWN